MANLDSMERIWFDRRKFEEAERKFAEHVASQHSSLVVQVTIVYSQVVKLVLLIRELVYNLTLYLLVMHPHQLPRLPVHLQLVYLLTHY